MVIVVFQPELRRALEQMGNTSLSKFFDHDDEEPSCVDEVVDAIVQLSKEKTGALVVFERETSLGEIAMTGVTLDSKVSKELLVNIFVPDTPLHDGAVIIKDNKIEAASCILPLTNKDGLDRKFGTRHRAAIGVTEEADCVVVVASEETGAMSITVNGKIIRDVSEDQLRKELKKRVVKPKNTYNINNIKNKINKKKSHS